MVLLLNLTLSKDYYYYCCHYRHCTRTISGSQYRKVPAKFLLVGCRAPRTLFYWTILWTPASQEMKLYVVSYALAMLVLV